MQNGVVQERRKEMKKGRKILSGLLAAGMLFTLNTPIGLAQETVTAPEAYGPTPNQASAEDLIWSIPEVEERSGTLSFRVVLSKPSENAMIGNASVAKVSILDNESDGNVNAEWKLDEGTGTMITDTKAKYQGTLNEGVSWTDNR